MKFTQEGFAELCKKSPAWVRKKIEQGMPWTPPAENGLAGEIDAGDAITWLLDQQDPAPRPDSQRDRLAREQADKVALENAERRRELVPVEVVGEIADAFMSEMAAQHEALPGRCAAELAMKEASEIRVRLLDECRAIRNQVAAKCDALADMAGAHSGPFADRVLDRKGAEAANA